MWTERAEPEAEDWADLAPSHLARYLFAVEYSRGKRVLDAGAGSGYGAHLLAVHGASVVGVDIDPQVVADAQQRFAHPALQYVVDDCEKLTQVEGPFDVICMFETIEHLQRPERFLEAARGLLAPAGLLLVSTPDRAASAPFLDGRPRNPFHVQEWYRDEFQALLTAHFADVEIRTQVQSTALAARVEALAALRSGLMWSNPFLVFLWRKLSWGAAHRRPWKRLAGLAAPMLSDFPIVPSSVVSLFGTSQYHVGICRHAGREK